MESAWLYVFKLHLCASLWPDLIATVFSCDAIVLSEFLMWTVVLMRKYGLVTFRPLASWVMLITCKSCVSRMLNRPCFLSSGPIEWLSEGD